MDESSGEALQFPVVCYFKIIAEDLEGMQFVIETVLQGLNVHVPVEPGRKSAAGKYVTYNVRIIVGSLEQMQRIDSKLRTIQGVRMVL